MREKSNTPTVENQNRTRSVYKFLIQWTASGKQLVILVPLSWEFLLLKVDEA